MKSVYKVMTFADLETSVLLLWQAIRRMYIMEKWIDIMKNELNDKSAKIKVSTNLTPSIPLYKRLNQGRGSIG